MRDIESLLEKAGLGKLSKSTASRICTELKERFEAFKRRSVHRGAPAGSRLRPALATT
jgi:transposase-like protein